jgi:outer membrane protein assembly factor BamB
MAWEQSFEAKSSAYVTATPELVFIAGPETPVVARRGSDGTEVWHADAGSDVEPVAGDGQLFVQSRGHMRALDMTTGSVRWEVNNAAVVLGGDWAALGGFGAFSGPALPVPMEARMMTAWTAGTVLVAAGRQLRALRTADGSETWRVGLSASIVGRVAADGGRVFAGLSDRTLIALDLASGTVAWRQSIPAIPGPLVAAAGQVYFGANNGICYAHRQRDGSRVWYYPKHAPAIGVPAADDRHAYVVLLTNVILAFDRESGNERWDEPIDARLSHGIKAAGGALFVTLGDGAALMLQAAAGAKTTIRAAPPPEQRQGGVRVESFDVTPDGTQVYLLTEVALKYTLSAYLKK